MRKISTLVSNQRLVISYWVLLFVLFGAKDLAAFDFEYTPPFVVTSQDERIVDGLLSCVDYRITLDGDGETYRVAFRSDLAYTGAQARITSSTQFSIVFPDPDGAGGAAVALTDFTNLTALTFGQSQLNSPTENPSRDYIFFAPTNSFTYTPFDISANTWTDAFTFKIDGGCTDSIYLMENTDPLTANPSYNSGQNFKVLAGGNVNLHCSNVGGKIPCAPDPPCVDYRVVQDSLSKVFTVAFRTTEDYTGSLARITNSTQVSLVMSDPDGTGPDAVVLTDFTNLTALTFNHAQANSPTENPSKDYVFFAPTNAGTYSPFAITANTWTDLFSFKAQGDCVEEVYLFDNITDPLNSNISINADNNFKILAEGNKNIYCQNVGDTLRCVDPPPVEVRVKVMLQGALLGTTNGLMRDDLRAGQYIPTAQPYSSTLHTRFSHVGTGGSEATTNTVLSQNVGTGNAIVDWVFLEFRTGLAGTTAVQTISGLVQRDGDVVAADGGPLMVDLDYGDYHIVIKHRNHLGVQTLNPKTHQAGGNPLVWDFTTMPNTELYANAGYETVQQVTITHSGGSVQALWAGNCNADGKTKYDGFGNDRQKMADEVFDVQELLGIPLPTLNYSNAFGYYQGDVNLNGQVKYDGFGNDRLLIQVVARNYPLNTSQLNNYNNLLEQVAN